MVCDMFDVPTSSYYEHKQLSKQINVERLEQRSEIKALFKASRNSAGSRSLLGMMCELGYQIGRFKVMSLMREAGIASKQPGPHRYKTAQVERPDIPNHLEREFDVSAPDSVWCGDITYIWAEGRWHYLAVVLDVVLLAGHYRPNRMQSWRLKHWIWRMSNEAGHKV